MPKQTDHRNLPGQKKDPWNILTIDLDAIASNYHFIRSTIPDGSTIYAVLKADAYGHGIQEVGACLADQGCNHFAVESPQEGIQLRQAGIAGEILIMNPIPEWMAELVVSHDLSPSIIHPSIIDPLNETAKNHNVICRVHLNLNVGLHRMGIAPSKIKKIVEQLTGCSHLEFAGLYGQPRDPESVPAAFQKIIDVRNNLDQEGLGPEHVHFANSATYLTHPETVKLGLRIGILLYGILPPEQAKNLKDFEHFKPAMKLTSRIVQLRQLKKGSLIGYRTRKRTSRDSVIATIPIGYAHGLDRTMTRKGHVLIQGKPAPFMGPISMNAATVDVTDIPDSQLGMSVDLVGTDQNKLNLNQQAQSAGTIAADLMTRFGAGVEREFLYREYRSSISKTIKLENKVAANIYTVRSEGELPRRLTTADIIEFLENNMESPGDDKDTYISAVSHALSRQSDLNFLIIAVVDKKLAGTLVNIRTNTEGFIPDNIFVYICTKKGYPKDEIAKHMIKVALQTCKGPVKIHVKPENPGIQLYEKLGFVQEYIEMRKT